MNMKKFLITIVTATVFLAPTLALAVPTQWDYNGTLLQPLQSASAAPVEASNFIATSTATSTLKNTNISGPTVEILGEYFTNFTNYVRSLFSPGTGIGISGGSISNTGVTSIVAGTNVTISGATGAVTVNASGGGSSASSTLLSDNNTFSGTNTFSNAISGSVTGNAGTATKLATARAINSVNFDGTGPITITAASSSALSDNNTFSGNTLFTASSTATKVFNLANASTSLETLGTEWLPSLGTSAGSFIAVDPNGKIIATTTPSSVSSVGTSLAVQLATTGALPANTYATGVLTEVGTGALTVDSTSVSVGNRILVKNEVAQTNNGIYSVTAAGSGIAAYVLTRVSDYNSSANVFPGEATYVVGGTVNADDWWALTTVAPITVGGGGTGSNLTYVESGSGAIAFPLSVSNGGTGLTSTSQNFFFAGPTSGSGAPTWRAIVAADIPTLNQNTTGSAATLTTARTINGVSFNGSANIVVASTTLLASDNNTWSGNQIFNASTTFAAKMNLQNATSTGFEVTGTNFFADGYTSAILEANASHQITAYGGASACTNQFVTALSALAATTCASVVDADISGQVGIAHGGTNASLTGASGLVAMNSGNTALSIPSTSYTLSSSLLTAPNASTTNLTAGTSLQIPNSSNPGPTVTAYVAESTNSPYQIQYGCNSGTCTLDPTVGISFTVSSSTVFVATTTSPTQSVIRGFTASSATCTFTPIGATGEIEWQYTNPASSASTPIYFAASSTPGIIAIASNNTPSTQATTTLMVGNTSGSPTGLNCTFYGGEAKI